jgi:hypothetical protein
MPPRTRAALLLALVALSFACSGERAPEAAETTAASGIAVPESGATSLGGDTALAPAPGTTAAGRPVPGTATAGAATATATPAAGGATATATVPTPGMPGPALGTPAATTPATPGSAGAAGTAGTATGGTPAGSAGTATSALAPTPAGGAATPSPGTPRAGAYGRAVVPFSPNERMEYDVRFGSLDVGDAAMQVNGIETVRGHETYHTVFRVSGGTLFFKVNDRYESWIDTRSLVSHRHVQQIDEGNYERARTFEIYVDRGVYRENDKPEQKTVAEPLDDGSFFYFVRTVPLEVGRTYTFERYFKPDRNPVTIKVLRRERVKVPAGSFDAIVIQPLIKTKGIFGEGGRAEIWLADDSTRAMLQMKSQLKFGSLNLYLKRMRVGTRPGAP